MNIKTQIESPLIRMNFHKDFYSTIEKLSKYLTLSVSKNSIIRTTTIFVFLGNTENVINRSLVFI
mgnify:CR=1 FL=1